MSFRRRTRRLRLVGGLLLLVAAALAAVSGTALAHTGGLRGASSGALDVPTWLFLTTGGGVVGASFLLASFVTDRAYISSIHDWGGTLPAPGRAARAAARLGGLALLLVTVYVGFVGPVTGIRNLAILVVWVVWWGAYVASTYLVANTWPALNPFRTLAEPLPSLDLEYPARFGAWPSVVGLLALIWIEIVTPIADDPRALAALIVAYAAVSVVGSVAFGTDAWFSNVDPVSRAFRYYGQVAPIGRDESGTLRFRLPGAALTDSRLVTGRDEVAFVVALLFVTTFDGFVGTEPWSAFARTAVGLGAPPLAVYLVSYLAGFGLFYGAYVWAVRAARSYGETYLTADYLARRFAPSLLAIAAGYHLAHNLTSVLTLFPTVVSVAAAPLSPPQNPPVLASVPGWTSGLEMAFVIVGHLVAVWVAHATAYELFPGRLQAIRSQYGVTLAMVLYTMVSLWIVTEPFVEPPFL
ncbi:hypothetical protein [Halegenticoccus soli]|uniref:hypothetical protein n=1 Tax=Halegenticoccus soli TaxID=1985678 RepID=UPI000C6CF8F4|nr:hypothetical protein [Halegenticoccus soli]